MGPLVVYFLGETWSLGENGVCGESRGEICNVCFGNKIQTLNGKTHYVEKVYQMRVAEIQDNSSKSFDRTYSKLLGAQKDLHLLMFAHRINRTRKF